MAGGLATVSAFLPWAKANLADRGADLLVVTRSGLDYGATGLAVVACGLAVVAVCLSTVWWSRSRILVAGMPLVAVLLAVLAITRLGAGDPLAYKLSTLRIGTFQTDAPVTSSATGVGLWLCLVAGVVLLVASLSWLVLNRRAGGLVYPPGPIESASADPVGSSAASVGEPAQGASHES